jgi:hypothetical protein
MEERGREMKAVMTRYPLTCGGREVIILAKDIIRVPPPTLSSYSRR